MTSEPDGPLVAFVDARGGVTGDMWLGAVVGAGASLEAIEQAVATLGIGDVRVSFGRVRRGGRDAVSVRVRPPQQTPRVATVSQVRALLRFAAFDDDVRERCLAVFDRLAHAISASRGVDPDEVQFHEVGMLDDLASIVGTCVGLADLGVDVVLAGPVGVSEDLEGSEVGRTIAHLLADHPMRPMPDADHAVTPAGAALVAALAESVGDAPALAVRSQGVGAPQRDLDGVGLLHLTLGVPLEPAPDNGE